MIAVVVVVVHCRFKVMASRVEEIVERSEVRVRYKFSGGAGTGSYLGTIGMVSVNRRVEGSMKERKRGETSRKNEEEATKRRREETKINDKRR